jgi:hypothetical protein
MTAGDTRATASRASSFSQEKLLTPVARALPAWSASIAAHGPRREDVAREVCGGKRTSRTTSGRRGGVVGGGHDGK